ncbi:unnamed protein product [Rhizoctonia solani]|uniref:Uncharacterized protein n=1 Tax=Rhizoctonia solani TaxID=456999 RepID=A0A8H3CSG2_9AGAM|nr:unnamed protein product [Rhizoctonia solani]
MNDPIAPLLAEIRHLELGHRGPDEELTRSARRIIDQAATNFRNGSSKVWQPPSIKWQPIDCSYSTLFAYHRPAPNKRSLLRTSPLAPPSNIPLLLDWDSGPTELESLGLSGLEEFRSCIKPSAGTLSVAQQLLSKRRRSIGERPQGLIPSLTKKPRFAVPLPSSSSFAIPAASAKVQNVAISVLQSKSSTRGNGSVRLRLGLSRRTNIGSKLESNCPSRTPYDVSVKVKITPRDQTESGPPSFSAAESSDISNSVGGTFALGFKIPDSALTTSRDGKLQVQLPMRTIPTAYRPSNVSKRTISKAAGYTGRVLAPASPSSLADRFTEITETFHLRDSVAPGSCADTSMLSDAAPECPSALPRDATPSSSFLPPPTFSALSTNLLPTSTQRVQPQEGETSNIMSDISLSASLSLSLEESGRSNSLIRKDKTTEGSSRYDLAHLDTSYDLKPNQLMTSVFYDSNQDSNSSQVDQTTYSPNPLAEVLATSNTYESLPWELSQEDDPGITQTHEDYDLRSPVSMAANQRMEAHASGPDDLDIHNHDSSEQIIDSLTPQLISNTGKIGPPDPKKRHSKLGIPSVLYDSSQDSPQPPPRKGNRSDQYDQEQDKHPIVRNIPIPRPSWSPDTSPQSRANYPLSGAQPSSFWGSFPSRTGILPDDLVFASRSLSLEDFEVRRPSDHQLRNASPVGPKSLTPLQPSATHHSNIPIGAANEDTYNMSPPHGAYLTADKRSGMSKLASYSSMEGSLVGSHSPILSFSPLRKPNIPDNSLESIESPDTSLRIDVGRSFRPNPIFKFPVSNPIAELEDDISCESQVLRPKLGSAPHGTQTTSRLALAPDGAPGPENNGLRDNCTSDVPSSDGMPAHEQLAVDEAENAGNQKILQSDAPPPASDHPSPLTPQPQPPSPLVSKIYKGLLHTVIPQPHFLPSLPCPPPSLTEGMLASLISPSFQDWLNKDGTLAQDQAAVAAKFLSDAWGRAAWVIPVRGRAPWEGCSGAIVSLRPIKERKKRIIIWTPASLRSFWMQMAGFRDTKRVGSLSMSFEAVPGKPPNLESSKQSSELKASRSFEFIKLYHDSRVSLKLRTILQVLEFADEDRFGIDANIPKEGEPETVTMRRLLGASTRLALLDSTGHIVLIS